MRCINTDRTFTSYKTKNNKSHCGIIIIMSPVHSTRLDSVGFHPDTWSLADRLDPHPSAARNLSDATIPDNSSAVRKSHRGRWATCRQLAWVIVILKKKKKNIILLINNFFSRYLHLNILEREKKKNARVCFETISIRE